LVNGFSPRSLGMGGGGIAVADDSVAWVQNPAGLGALNVPVMEGKTWGNDALGSYTKEDDDHSWGLSWSGWTPAQKLGAGVGYMDMPYSKSYGAGFGMGLKNSPLSLGINVVHTSWDSYSYMTSAAAKSASSDSQTLFNLGALYQFARPEAAPIRLGLLVEDLTNETDIGPWFDLGIAGKVTPDLLLAVDCVDVTNETDDGPYFDPGAEYTLPTAKAWKVRAGLYDSGDGHELTLGAGYSFVNNWRVDFGWQNSDPDATWAVGVSKGF
jgi:hypothetical protein